MKILELFGGIGACSKALERLGIDYEIADYVEIDKYAVKSFNAIHNTNFEPQDICKWDKDIEVDLVMHGSPCQDFSLAGLQAGGDEGSGTRSSLMYETIRIVKKLKPKYVIWENVKNVISKKHRHNFDNYLNKMEELGYKNYWQVLNAKDYGIPQNRERVFTVSIRNDITIDKTVKSSVAVNFEREKNSIINSDKEIYQCECESGWQDNKVGLKVSPTIRANNNNTFILEDNRHFEFPPKQELKLKLKDMLENEVDEKYYLSDKLVNCFMSNGTGKYPRRERFLQNINRKNQDIANSIITTEGNKPTCNFIKIKNNTKQGYLEAHDGDGIDLAQPNSKTRRGRVQKDSIQTLTTQNNLGVCVIDNYDSNEVVRKYGLFDTEKSKHQAGSVYDENGLSPTLDTMQGGYRQPCIETTTNDKPSVKQNLRIRKLTPKECWRLMGFDDEDFEKAAKVNSNTQLYKQAGNSIVVNVLEKILENLLCV